MATRGLHPVTLDAVVGLEPLQLRAVFGDQDNVVTTNSDANPKGGPPYAACGG